MSKDFRTGNNILMYNMKAVYFYYLKILNNLKLSTKHIICVQFESEFLDFSQPTAQHCPAFDNGRDSEVFS